MAIVPPLSEIPARDDASPSMTIRPPRADARVEELTGDDVRRVGELASAAGFSHLSPEDVTKVTSARSLYRFDALKDQRY